MDDDNNFFDTYDRDALAVEGRVPFVEEELSDQIGLERMLHRIPQDQLEVLVCLYLGFKPAEIVKILKYPNIIRYYNVSAKLRKIYREQKNECLGV